MSTSSTTLHPAKRDQALLAHHLLAEYPVLAQKIAKAIDLPQDEAPAMLTEVLRFLDLIVWSGKTLTPPHILDLAWHEFILFTRGYDHFCRQQYDRFVHHQPGGSREENGRQLRNTLSLYQVCFGAPNPRYWGEHGIWSEAADCGPCEGQTTDPEHTGQSS